MTYQEAVSFLFNSLPAFERSGSSDYKPGLETSRALSAWAGNPHVKYPTVHVAGTNGKGSVTSMTAAVLQEAGYKVGLYTSPHLVDFRERIRVNGEMIPEECVVDFVERYLRSDEAIRALAPTFFELTTIMAFEYFARCGVDLAVIETGLGGRLDTTNIIRPVLSVITNVSLDHTALLGDTEEKIAREKSFIIKEHIPSVIGPDHQARVEEVFRSRAAECSSRLVKARHTSTGEGLGQWQADNRCTVHAVLDVLRSQGWNISPEAERTGIEKVGELTGLRGRWSTFGENPLQIYDTGHNPGAWKWLGRQIDAHPGGVHMVIGFVGDKDVDAILHLLPRRARYYFTAPHNHRALSAEALKTRAEAAGVHGDVYDDVDQAYAEAMKNAASHDLVFVGGSNYLIGEATFLR